MTFVNNVNYRLKILQVPKAIYYSNDPSDFLPYMIVPRDGEIAFWFNDGTYVNPFIVGNFKQFILVCNFSSLTGAVKSDSIANLNLDNSDPKIVPITYIHGYYAGHNSSGSISIPTPQDEATNFKVTFSSLSTHPEWNSIVGTCCIDESTNPKGMFIESAANIFTNFFEPLINTTLSWNFATNPSRVTAGATVPPLALNDLTDVEAVPVGKGETLEWDDALWVASNVHKAQVALVVDASVANPLTVIGTVVHAKANWGTLLLENFSFNNTGDNLTLTYTGDFACNFLIQWKVESYANVPDVAVDWLLRKNGFELVSSRMTNYAKNSITRPESNSYAAVTTYLDTGDTVTPHLVMLEAGPITVQWPRGSIIITRIAQ